jgi:hypothetical protein
MSFSPSPYLFLVAAHVAAVCIVLVAVWRGAQGRMRLLAALAGAAAVWLPLLIQVAALGEPKHNPPDKVLKLLGAVEDNAKNIYLFVDTEPGEPAPRMYTVKQVKNKYDDNQTHVIQLSYSQLLGVKVNLSETGDFEVVYLDYEMPDWDKDDLQHGYPTPVRRNN